MKRNLSLMAIAALAAGLLTAGCGGNDDESSDTGTEAAALTKSEFIAEADAICKEGNDAINASQGPQSNDSAEVEAFVTDTLVPNIQQQVDGIEELTPPEGDEDEVQAITDAAQEGIDTIEADPQSVTGNSDPFAEANTLAKEYGLKVCGQG